MSAALALAASDRREKDSIATEVELKLVAQPADLPRLKQALAAMAEGAPGPARALVSTYFDTPNLTLRRRGLTLRVREEEGRFTQTVKADRVAGAGWPARGEWEDALAECRPDLAAPESGRQLPPGLDDDLRPLFTTKVTRQSVIIAAPGAARIEAAVDEGVIGAATGVEAISEIELELKAGAAAALYDTALRLLETAPLRFETRSKSERGYRLVAGDGSAPAAVRAEPVALDPRLSPERALQRIGRACLVHLLRNEPAALAGQAEGVHQMRVAVRRLRSALSAFKGALSPGERRRITAELKGLSESLAAARNFDVFAADLLTPARTALPHQPDLDHLAAALDWARQRAYQRVREEIQSARYTAATLQLLRWFEAVPQHGSGTAPARPAVRIGDIAPHLLDRRRRAVRKRGKGFRRQDAAERHRLRIAVKKLRYTIELLGSLFGDRSSPFVKRLRRLQDELGYANDVRVAGELLAELCAPAEPQSRLARAGALVLEWHRDRLAARDRKLRKRLRRLVCAAPFWRDHAEEPADCRF